MLHIHANEAICKFNAQDINIKYNKHKTHPDGVIIRCNSYFCEYLSKEANKKKKKGQIPYITSRDDQIATSAKLLDITHAPYGFNADLIDTIN